MKSIIHRLRLRGRRRIVAILLLTGLVLGTAVAIQHNGSMDSKAPKGQWVQPEQAATAQVILLEGRIAPVTVVTVPVPYDGKVVRRLVRPGDEVAKGALLFELSRDELEAERGEAEVAMIQARQALDQASNWQNSPDYMAAKRQLASAKAALGTARRRLTETQTLFERGIVARIEVESAEAEVASAQEQEASAGDTVQSAQEKGNQSQRRIAELEYETRLRKFAGIVDKLRHSNITAPIAGVVLSPPVSSTAQEGTQKEFVAGTPVNSNEILLSLGDTTSWLIRSTVDEFDILRLRAGMPVSVSLASNEEIRLQGELTRVSSQARKEASDGEGSSSGRKLATYEVDIIIRTVPADVRRMLRIGMSTQMTLKPDDKQTALVIPLAAVTSTEDKVHTVLRRVPGTDRTETRSVKVGKTLATQVEILGGLTVDDKVWLPSSTSLSNPTAVPNGEEGDDASSDTPSFPGLEQGGNDAE